MPLARPGDLLQDNQNNSYRIDKYLGEGVTAEVYQATREDNNQLVALKILRPSLPPEIVQSFRDEVPTIGELVQYSHQRYPDEPLHVPRVFGKSSTNAPREFMVMEFVTGQPLDVLIIATQGLVINGREAEALLIARQVLQVLIVLHEDIRRSYSDFQLKNIWWLPEQSLVKVMDWNHVSVRAKEGGTPSGAVVDLIRFGAYLYQLLTGQGAFQTGETEAELAERAGEKWARVSLGTRTILLKALHPNSQNRYQTAREFLTDVDAMLTMWQQDEDDLYDEANLALRQAKNRTLQSGSDQHTVTEYAQAVFTASRAINLFILRSRETRRIERMREELDTLTANISPIWGVGKNYYQLGVYSEALKQWEPEARNLKRLDLWRWVMVAQISRQEAPALKDAYLPIRVLLEEAITHLENKEWEQAKETLTQIARQGVSGPEFYVFGYEAEVQDWLKQARSVEKVGQWNQAGQAYAEAAKAMRQIQDKTYLELLSGVLFTPEQLDEKVISCRRQDRGYEKESAVINGFRLRIAQNNQPVSYLIEQLIENPSQPRLLDVVLEEAEKEDCPLELAIQLLSAAACYGRASTTIFSRLAEKREIQRQEIIEQYNKKLADEYAAKAEAQRTNHHRWIGEQTALLQQALQANQWERVYTIASDMGGDVLPEAKNAILTTFNTAGEKRDWPLVLALGDALSLIYGGDEKTEIQQRMDDARRCQEIDLTVQQFNDQLLQGEFSVAAASLNQLEGQINALHDLGEQQRRQRELATQKKRFEGRRAKVIKEVPVEQLIAVLNQNELRDLSMNINNNLQSLTDKLETVSSKNEGLSSRNEELEKRNEQLLGQLEGSKGRGGGWVMALGLLLLMILLLMGGGYLLKITQIDPLATQVANLPSVTPLVVAAGTSEPLPNAGREVTVTEKLTLTPSPSPTASPTATNTPEPPTPTPITLVSNSLQIGVTPAPTLDFIVDVNGTPTSPLELEDKNGDVSGGDIDTVFDWPTFVLTLSNDKGWHFDLSGETVRLKHEGQAEAIPLQIQMTSDSMAERVSVDVMKSWVISRTNGAEAETIFIDGNFLKQEEIVPGDYTVAWLIPGTSPLFLSEPIPYVPAVTVTWVTTELLRSRPEWTKTLEIENAGISVKDSEVLVNVHGFICNKTGTNFMFLAITLDSDPAQIYWLRNTGTKELVSSDDITKMLTSVFEGIEECVAP